MYSHFFLSHCNYGIVNLDLLCSSVLYMVFWTLKSLDSLQDCRKSSILYYGFFFLYFEVGQLKGLHFKPLFVHFVQVDKILVLLCWQLLQTVKFKVPSSGVVLGWVIFKRGLVICQWHRGSLCYYHELMVDHKPH